MPFVSFPFSRRLLFSPEQKKAQKQILGRSFQLIQRTPEVNRELC